MTSTQLESMALSTAWQDVMASQFSNPLTREERIKYFGDGLIQSWKREFESRCWGSPQFAEISLHTLFGQLPAIRKIPVIYERNYSDIRMHCMLFQRSGTGKGRGYDFMATTAQQLNLVCMKADSTSDGMLLGSYEQVEGEEEPLHIPGLLDPARQPPVNIFMQNEATLMLDAKRTDWSKDFMTYYQVAMNPIGTPDNLLEKTNLAMRGDMISINPTVSFYLTTYPPDKLLETITKAGFIQRMTTLYNIQQFDERVEHWKVMAMKTGQKREGDDDVPKIVAALKHINSHYQKNNFISVAEETRGTFNSVMKELYMPLMKVNKAMREHLGDFIPRTYENVVKCAYQHAMLRLSPLVENVDIVYSMSVLKPAWSRMITYMEESDEVMQPLLSKWNKWKMQSQQIYEHILKLQKERGKYNDGWVKKETMIKFLSSSDMGWDKSPSTTRSRIDKMIIDLKFFEESKIDNVKCIRMKTKSR